MEERTEDATDKISSDITLVPVIELSWGINPMELSPS
jgi:hypothetical protein